MTTLVHRRPGSPVTRALLLLVTASSALAAQARIPPARPLAPPDAAILLHSVLDVRETSGGVLVHDFLARQVRLLDHALRPIGVVVESTATTGTRYGRYTGRLIALGADSSVFVDPATGTMQLLGPDGAMGRLAAFPRPAEAGALAGPEPPAFDGPGRLVYAVGARAGSAMGGRGGLSSGPGRPAVPEALLLIRVDPLTRQVDTLARVRVPLMPARVVLEDPVPVSLERVDPLAACDGWTVLDDGTVVIVRGDDYHLEFVRPDGRREQAPRVPFEWSRLSDQAKQALLDSLGQAQESRERAERAARQGAPPRAPAEIGAAARRAQAGETDVAGVHYEFVAASELPDYPPVFRRGAVRADRAGRIWVRLARPPVPGEGPTYDVLDAAGARVDRVVVPEGRTIVGFGPNAVYLASASAEGVLLERSALP